MYILHASFPICKLVIRLKNHIFIIVGDTLGTECSGSSMTTDIPDSSSNVADIETKSLVASSGPSLGMPSC